MIGEFLRRVTAALDANGIPYMLTGSLASSMYGVPRATNDIDIVVAPSREQLLSIVQLFQRLGLTVTSETAVAALRNKTQFNVIDFPRGLKADLIVRKDREFSVTEFDRRETHEVEGMRLTIATPEDVLLAKLEWAQMGDSERQIVDCAGMIKVQGDALDLPYIRKWVERLGLAQEWAAAQRRAV
ncbi:MAG TPA: hypothetical protein VFV49_05750 [Thermoanaerobaculia bacterium]|nr:hypothetical protein [Thermoanaerobaculia bacterium]